MSSEEQRSLKELKYKKGRVKATLTNFETYIGTIQNAKFAKVQMLARLTKVKESWSEFRDICAQIALLEEDEGNDIEADLFEERYFDLVSKADELLLPNSEMHVKSDNVPHSQVSSHIQGHLPQIPVPKFSGNFEEWVPFCQMFNSVIESNKTLLTVQKFHYLKSGLSGEAADCIQDLPITADNYDIAWATLKERYDNKKRIIRKHIQGIQELPHLTREDAEILKQIVNGVQKHLRALKALNRPTEYWDDWLVYVISSKLDRITNKEWEATSKITHVPSYAELIEFLSHKLNTLESVGPVAAINTNRQKKPYLTHFAQEGKQCCVCKGLHPLYNCPKFLKQSVEQRLRQIKQAKLCMNCLRSGQSYNKCKFGHCQQCELKHNTLLHIQTSSSMNAPRSSSADAETSKELPESIAAHSLQAQRLNQVLLATACIQVTDIRGNHFTGRALLDPGSQSNFISSSFFKKLGLKHQLVNVPICGIGQTRTKINKSAVVNMKSKYTNFSMEMNCLVIENICNEIPIERINKQELDIPKNLNLADPEFHVPRGIDVLIGAEWCWHLLSVGQIRLPNTQLLLQKTQLGWIISGSLTLATYAPSTISCNLSVSQSLDKTLKKFWEIEEKMASKTYTAEENACEKHFVETYRRDSNGRFIVKLPFKEDPLIKLGNSKTSATKRFYALERKFGKQPALKRQYAEFMEEYLRLGHMKLVENDADSPGVYYLPHHAVIKWDSLTAKIRVVFDASAKTSSNKSLNDILIIGPVVQEDLFSIICKFRTYKFVVTADITKMYRQILVDSDQTRFQRIVWRTDPNEELRSYELKTVTYGTAPASFLATRVLQELSDDERHNFPVGSEIVRSNFYVDDLLAGADTIAEIETIFKEVSGILCNGGFEIRKWACNDQQALKKLLPKAEFPMVLNLADDDNIKALGIQWNTYSDNLQYKATLNVEQQRICKRTVLSQVARIFDPLGLLGPAIVRAKIFMQELWRLQISWDESLPLALHTEWQTYQNDFIALNRVNVQRNVMPYKDRVELHGFGDASETAYGACIYVRCGNLLGDISCRLLCSKSRVAPLKATTIPRLGLCGALLLAQMMSRVKQVLRVDSDAVYYWTDSTIVLAWLNTTSRQLKTFVANRTAEIQELSDITNWHHIGSSQNPADLLSRGTSPAQLIQDQLWWNGPPWLLQRRDYWPQSHTSLSPTAIPEMRAMDIFSNISTLTYNPFAKFSTFTKLQRVVAYCRRFIQNVRRRLRKQSDNVVTGPLTTLELSSSLLSLIRIVQEEVFTRELHRLKSKQKIDNASRLQPLQPFLDAARVMRIGGRLKASQISYDERHPIILPGNHLFTRLLIERVHRGELHAGTQATLAAIRRRFWPLSGRNSVRYVLKRCVTCFKSNPTALQPTMGDLPSSRVQPARPFVNTGVDYCGPFTIRDSKRRNAPRSKAYVAVFVCMAVKAVHLEVVTALDTTSFLDALRRFIGRRGMIAHLYSDNGTNFVGANNELKELRAMFQNEANNQTISNYLTNEGIQWHFTPPRAPHFGGLWEAAVKSFKYHMKRIVGNALLTYEEMCTISIQIEAILNSRPLLPLSEDPSDLSVLTPGHYLIGDSLRSVVEPSLGELKLNLLSRAQMVENLRQHFWKRWSREYLQQLQRRTKWYNAPPIKIEVGHLVLIKEDNVPPTLWPVGRIVALHPGPDGIVRAASAKTIRGEVKRPVNKLSQLEVGDSCGPGNERQCILVTNCPEATEKLQKRQQHGLERCGFQGRLEIVCCTKKSVIPKVPLRNSIAACELYSKEFTTDSQPFIIGGVNATLGEFPYIAALGYADDNGGTKWGDCGGSLISENFVLTAAHCMVRIDSKEPTMVRLGKVDLVGDEDKVQPQDIPVAEIIVHPAYRHIDKLNDIGLVKLKNSAKFTEYVKPVCLYTKSDDPLNLVVAGWGVIDKELELTSRFLQKGYVSSYDLTKCNQTYYDSVLKKSIFNTQLCALSLDAKPQDTCQGDSGGPIQIENRKDNKETPLIVVGITSFGRGCGAKVPSIYTRVSSYIDWIEGYVWS